jgi:phospho-N-acetylmuramoyl-pentapeptide-transferase
VTFDIGVFYVPFVMFVMIAFSNSVNLTDGLDGLASGITAMVSFFVLIAGCTFGYLSIPIVFGAVAGGCLGFLMFNKNPAKIFMGDTGSMALGGVLAAGALMMKIEFLLAVAGIVYVAEALSVIIQVTYFKKTKKRIFKMAPLHHHFELCGMNEKKVVLMFWAAAFVCCVVAILLMNI